MYIINILSVIGTGPIGIEIGASKHSRADISAIKLKFFVLSMDFIKNSLIKLIAKAILVYLKRNVN